MDFLLGLVVLLLITIVISNLCERLEIITQAILGIVLFAVWTSFFHYHLSYLPWLEANSWRPCFEDHSSITTAKISMIDNDGEAPFGDSFYIQQVNSPEEAYMLWYVNESNGSPEKKALPISQTEIVYIGLEATPLLQTTVTRGNCSYNTRTGTHRLNGFHYSYILYIHEGCIKVTYNH